MVCNNSLNKDSPQLSYKTPQEQANYVSMTADSNNNIMNKHVIIEHPILSSPHIPIEHPTSVSSHVDNTVINIQLLYDPNALTEPELWDGNFHPISLHRAIKYLTLDSKNIKDSLNSMAKYITNKQVDPAKSNDL